MHLTTRVFAPNEVEKTTLSIDGLARAFTESAPQLDIREQKLSVGLYRRLATGSPVSVGNLAEATGIDAAHISRALNSWPGVYFDDRGDVIGFWGLSIEPMPHRLKFEDRTLYTWCAWDGLFIPQLVNAPATLITHCPVSEARLSVFVDSGGNFETSMPEIVMSFLEPKRGMFDQDIIGQFCHYIYLFQDWETARQWTRSNPKTLLLDLAQAMELGRLKNQKQFADLI